MLLTETYKNRLRELAGIKKTSYTKLLKEVEDLYTNSNKRVKFDMNIMKQAIEGGLEVGMVFQSDNEKYTMPTWKMRVIQPVTMGYDKKGQLVIRGVHVVGQSEKKAIETGIRSAEAKNEWRLFKAVNVKSMFLTGRVFDKVALPGYNPNDSAMSSIIAKFDPKKAVAYQAQLKTAEKMPEVPLAQPKEIPTAKPTVQKKPIVPPAVKTPKVTTKKTEPGKEDTKNLEKKLDKLNKLI